MKKGQGIGGSPCHPPFTPEPAKTVRDSSHEHVSLSKIQDRDVRRAKEFRARKGVLVRWELLTIKLKRIEYFHLHSMVWLQWMKDKPIKEG